MPIASDETHCQNLQELDSVLESHFSRMPKDFHTGKDAARKKYTNLYKAQEKPPSAHETPCTPSITRTSLQTQAITLLRRWDTATDERERAYCMKACKAFLNGEDPDLEMKMNAVGSEHKAGPGHAAHGSGYVAQIDKLDEFQKREMLILRKSYHNNWVKRITLINKDCYTLVPEDIPYSAEDMKAAMFWIDCWFKSEDQPQGQHAIMMRKFFDMCSKEGSVVLVFGRAETLYKHWQPLMRDGFAESTLKWYLDPKIFFVIRSRRRDAFTRNRTTWHSLTEEVLCFTRKAQSQATKRKQSDMVCPPTRNYDKMFALKYGDINGHPGNVYNHYEPPTNAVRLRDYNLWIYLPKKAIWL